MKKGEWVKLSGVVLTSLGIVTLFYTIEKSINSLTYCVHTGGCESMQNLALGQYLSNGETTLSFLLLVIGLALISTKFFE